MKCQHSLILAVSFMMFYNLASGFEFTDCGPTYKKLTNIVIAGCNTTSNACVFKRGTEYPIRFGFTVYKVVTVVRASAYGAYQDNFYPLLDDSNGCENSDVKCPLQKGSNHVYKGVLSALKVPTAQVTVVLALRDQDTEVIGCVRFPAIIQ